MTSASGPSGSARASDAGSHGSVGAYLARQRRLRGIPLEELAQATRIPQRSLERLEAGAFDAVSDGFVRGFVRTVAVALGLDGDEAVSRLLVEPGEPMPTRPGWGLSSRRLVAIAGLLILLATAVAGGFALIDSLAGEVSRPVMRRDPVRALHEASPPDSRPRKSVGSGPAPSLPGPP